MNKVFATRTVWWIVIGVALALFAVRNIGQATARRDLVALEQKSLHPAKPDPQSETGYQFGQRSEILTPDGYHWVMQTQHMLARGDLRVRKADYDNVPAGREVHWNSGLRWWLGGQAWLWSALDGSPAPVALERAALWSSPLLLLVVLAILVPLVWRWQGMATAALLVLCVTAVPPMEDLFAFADPDHHGLVAVFGLCTVMFLLMGGGGWVEGDDGRKARRWFVASGVAGGAGLWVSSATQVPVLIGVGLGAVAGVWWFGRVSPKAKADALLLPGLWRWWGGVGAAASFCFYLIEYFPSNFGMRLEVNHPFYAIAWLSAGELLFRTTRWMTGGGFAKPGREQALALAAVVGLLLLPLVILFAGESTFWVSDRLLWALHRDYIVEFCSLFRRLGDVEPSRWLANFSFLPVVAFALCCLVWRGGLGAVGKARLTVALAPALVFFGLSLYQIRWSGISCALWLVVLVQVVGLLGKGRVKPAFSRGWRVALVLLAAATLLPSVQQAVSTGVALARGQKNFSKLDLRMSVLRDLARWLRARTGNSQGVVLGGPSATTALIYHGGFKGLGTLYWENKDGLHSMVDIFSTTQDEVARDLVAQHGITHIVVVSWDSFAQESARLALGLRRGEEAPENTFLARLSKGQGCPFWLRPVYYPAPEMSVLKEDYVLVYEVVPEQSREEAALRFGQMMFDKGERENAEKFLGVLVRHFPNYLTGWVALAQVQLGLEHTEAFRASMERIGVLRGAAPSLALDDRIGLATVLDAVGDAGGMRSEIERCVSMGDEASLRRLNANALLAFVLLAKESGVGEGRPEIMRLAVDLLPAEMARQVQAGESGGVK